MRKSCTQSSESGASILFVNGNETMLPYRIAPLGIAFVASAAERAGHNVTAADFPTTRRAFQKLLRKVSTQRPDFLAVGIRNLDNSDFHGFQSYLSGPARLIRGIREASPSTITIVGGSAGTVDPDVVAETTGCDHLILGEGEEGLPELISRLQSGETVPRVLGANRSRIPFRVGDTRALRPPRLYRWFPNLGPYLKGDAGYPVQTKRGCPLKCTYCTYARIEGARYRFLNPDHIADEIRGAMEHGVRDFEFVDSTFNLPPGHAMNVLRVLKDRRLFANYVGTGLNPGRLPDKLLEAMRELGFRSVILTAESASDTMLTSYRKGYDRTALHGAAGSLRRHGITGLWVFLLGGPGETPQTVAETLDFIRSDIPRGDSVYITSGIRVYPGSPIDNDLDRGRFAASSLPGVSDEREVPFFYSEHTPPEWMEPTLKEFQIACPNVMLSCEGHSRLTSIALKALQFLPLPKPYWRYIPQLNRVRHAARRITFGAGRRNNTPLEPCDANT